MIDACNPVDGDALTFETVVLVVLLYEEEDEEEEEEEEEEEVAVGTSVKVGERYNPSSTSIDAAMSSQVVTIAKTEAARDEEGDTTAYCAPSRSPRPSS